MRLAGAEARLPGVQPHGAAHGGSLRRAALRTGPGICWLRYSGQERARTYKARHLAPSTQQPHLHEHVPLLGAHFQSPPRSPSRALRTPKWCRWPTMRTRCCRCLAVCVRMACAYAVDMLLHHDACSLKGYCASFRRHCRMRVSRSPYSGEGLATWAKNDRYVVSESHRGFAFWRRKAQGDGGQE